MYFCKITNTQKIEIYFVRRIIRFCYATMPQILGVYLGTDGAPFCISKLAIKAPDNAAAHYVVNGDTDARTITNLMMECVKLGMVDEAMELLGMM
jgi:hypothetical protein